LCPEKLSIADSVESQKSNSILGMVWDSFDQLSEYSGDCKDQDGGKGRCVVGAIKNYTDQLLDYGKNTQCKPLLWAYNLYMFPNIFVYILSSD